MTVFPHMQHHKQGWTRAVVLLMCAIGLIAATSLTTAMVSHARQSATKPPFERYFAAAKSSEMMQDYPHAFHYYGKAMEFATNQTQRQEIALEKAELLVKPGTWRPAADRHIMAANLVLTLIDNNFALPDKRRLAACALKLLPAYRDPEFRKRAQDFIADIGPPDTLPYTFNALAFETYFALSDATAACKALAALEAAKPESTTAKMATRHYRARTVWRALKQAKWRQAFATIDKRFPTSADLAKQEQYLLDLLTVNVNALRQSELPAYQLEAMAMYSQIANRKGEWEAAIKLLQKAVFETNATGRLQAAAHLLKLINQQGDTETLDEIRANMMKDPSIRTAVVNDIRKELDATDDPSRFKSLAETIVKHLPKLDLSAPDNYSLVFTAAQRALEANELQMTKTLIQAIAQDSHQKQADFFMLQALLADKQGNHAASANHLYKLLAWGAPAELEREARFMLVEQVSKSSERIVDLVGNAIGNAQKLPRDIRSLEGILTTAQKLEALTLYPLALSYYQKLALLGSIRGPQSEATQAISANGMIGQARVLLAMGKDLEADAILRRINSHKEWASVWSESAPLWSAIAMRMGQPHEAYRRWKQACGPSNDTLLPTLFAILVPNPEAVPIQPVSVSRPAPNRPPIELIRSAAEAAFNKVLEQGNPEAIDALLSQMQAATQWHDILPLNQYRLAALNRIQASHPAKTVLDWMQRHPIETDDNSDSTALLPPDELRERLRETDAIAMQARTRIF